MASPAAAAARRKERHPEAYCPRPRCLWHTGGGYCPRHALLSDEDMFREELDLERVACEEDAADYDRRAPDDYLAGGDAA